MSQVTWRASTPLWAEKVRQQAELRVSNKSEIKKINWPYIHKEFYLTTKKIVTSPTFGVFIYTF